MKRLALLLLIGGCSLTATASAGNRYVGSNCFWYSGSSITFTSSSSIQSGPSTTTASVIDCPLAHDSSVNTSRIEYYYLDDSTQDITCIQYAEASGSSTRDSVSRTSTEDDTSYHFEDFDDNDITATGAALHLRCTMPPSNSGQALLENYWGGF